MQNERKHILKKSKSLLTSTIIILTVICLVATASAAEVKSLESNPIGVAAEPDFFSMNTLWETLKNINIPSFDFDFTSIFPAIPNVASAAENKTHSATEMLAEGSAETLAEVCTEQSADNEAVVEPEETLPASRPSDAYSQRELEMFGTMLYWECGNGCTIEHQLDEGGVFVNRLNDPRFPDTIEGLLTQKSIINGRLVYQYTPKYANGTLNIPSDRYDEFIELAKRCLDGEPQGLPDNVIYADTNKHGTGVYKTYKTPFGTTYFCYG